MRFLNYLLIQGSHLLQLAVAHAAVVLLSVLLSTTISLLLGIFAYRHERLSSLCLKTASVLLTIPSFALFGLLIPILGLGYKPTVTALVIYALLPVLRNTLAGLRTIDGAVIESARGVGMGPWALLFRIELPIAWPVVLTGMRVTTLLTVAIAAVAGVVNGPGLGNDIFAGLSRLGSPTGLYLVLGGTLGVIVLALLFDLLFLLVGRLTVSGGIQ